MDLLLPYPAACLLNQPCNIRVSFGAGMRQRHHSVLVRQVGIGPRLQHKSSRFLMARAALTKNHDFQQTGPTEIVDVIHVDARRQQQPDRLYMRALACWNQGVAAETVSDRKIRPARDHFRNDLGPTLRTRQQPGRVTIGSLHIDAGARINERFGDGVVTLTRPETGSGYGAA